uniref:Uncharacterized protein n=1 Tax=Candidozyma auris TaxID=498019 RepID=A0A0L0NVQ0_CANAR
MILSILLQKPRRRKFTQKKAMVVYKSYLVHYNFATTLAANEMESQPARTKVKHLFMLVYFNCCFA